MSEKASNNFENGIFWELYSDLERQFQNFLEYVPYLPRNETVYSFKLLNLIITIGGHIDSAFKEMARYPQFSRKDGCIEILKRAKEKKGIISTGVKAFDEIYGISTKKVKFKPQVEREDVFPFRCDRKENKLPQWWKFHTDLKHDVGINIKEASLKNARDALAGAFLLNVRHIPSGVRLYEHGVLKTGYIEWRIVAGGLHPDPFNPESVRKILEKKEIESPFFVETPVFIYKYNQEY